MYAGQKHSAKELMQVWGPQSFLFVYRLSK